MLCQPCLAVPVGHQHAVLRALGSARQTQPHTACWGSAPSWGAPHCSAAQLQPGCNGSTDGCLCCEWGGSLEKKLSAGNPGASAKIGSCLWRSFPRG